MVKNDVLPFLRDRLILPQPGLHQSFYFCCVGESVIDEVIRNKFPSTTDLDISSLSHFGVVTLTLSLPDRSEKIKQRLEEYSNILRNELKEYIFSEKEISLEKHVGNLLAERGETLAVAESCTGGLLSSKITAIPGSSDYFLGGIISYSNEIKANQLDVPRSTLETYGAVSRETACEMAKDICEKYNSDWGISITGIAGPSGGTEEKPVGTVWTAVFEKDKGVFPFKKQHPGGRETVRERSCTFAVDQLRRLLNDFPPHK